MGLSAPLRKLDDRFLGDRLRRKPRAQDGEQPGDVPPGDPGTVDERPVERRSRERVDSPSSRGSGNGVRKTIGIIYQVSRLVLALLALAMLLGIVLILTPSNPDNVIVRNGLDLAEFAAGPFRDLFTADGDPKRALAINYSVAGVLYLLAAALVTRLPGGRR
ncbi:MAG: hypothetical protein M3486_00545 [Actinomycetota bacterium]|nr:hypothetical protein [Actinomycetota bacterium]